MAVLVVVTTVVRMREALEATPEAAILRPGEDVVARMVTLVIP